MTKETKIYLGKFKFTDIQSEYPFHYVKSVMNISNGEIFEIPEGKKLIDYIQDVDNHQLNITIIESEVANNSKTEYIFETDGFSFILRKFNEKFFDPSEITGEKRTFTEVEVVDEEA